MTAASHRATRINARLDADHAEKIEYLKRATGLPVNACGGVITVDDALACLDAGATTVQVYTGLIYRGPALVGELARGLAARARAPR